MLEIPDPVIALDFDVAMAFLGGRLDQGKPIDKTGVEKKQLDGFEKALALQATVHRLSRSN